MMTWPVSFSVGIDRGTRPRNEAAVHLQPVRDWLTTFGVTFIGLEIKVSYALPCTADKAVFESIFGVTLTPTGNNWNTSDSLVIPIPLKDRGVTSVTLDNEENLEMNR